jgi:hypothetical protein
MQVSQTEISAVVASLTSDIDALYVLDQQAKALALQVKALKDAIANKYGESAKDAAGVAIPFQGELHSVTVQLVPVAGTVDYAKLCVAYGITEEILKTYRKAGRADIRVTPSK